MHIAYSIFSSPEGVRLDEIDFNHPKATFGKCDEIIVVKITHESEYQTRFKVGSLDGTCSRPVTIQTFFDAWIAFTNSMIHAVPNLPPNIRDYLTQVSECSQSLSRLTEWPRESSGSEDPDREGSSSR